MPTTKRKTPAKRATTKKPTARQTEATQPTTVVQGFNREDNIHMLIGIILLVIGLYQLRTRLLGLVFIIVGILFVTGYFEKGKKK